MDRTRIATLVLNAAALAPLSLVLIGCDNSGSPMSARGWSGTQSVSQTTIEINGAVLSEREARSLERFFGAKVAPGRYWYDRLSGLWGHTGGPAMGYTVAGLALPGPMPANASGGTSGTFVNGRQITVDEAAQLEYINNGRIGRFRWWLDSQCNIGLEGMPPAGNLIAMTRARFGGGGGGRKSIFRPGEIPEAEVVGGGVIMGHGRVYTPP